MTTQFTLFEDTDGRRKDGPNLPEGFLYRPELISASDEEAILTRVRKLPLRDFEFHGYTGKRRVVSFGWHYDFSARQLQRAEDMPDYLLALRAVAAPLAGLEPETMRHVLVTEYGPGAGIGWHRDKAVFGQVVGVSLLAPCLLRLRRALAGSKWERVKVEAAPRSAYVLTGPARYEWEHSIQPVELMRYSITFRNVREE